MPTKQPRQRLTKRLLQQAIANDDPSLLANVDQRYAHVKRLRGLCDELVIDYASNELRAGELCLIRRAAFLQLQAEIIEANWASAQLGKTPAPLGVKNLRLYATITNALKRVLLSLHGMRPLPPPSLLPALPRGSTCSRAEAREYLQARGINTDLLFNQPDEDKRNGKLN